MIHIHDPLFDVKLGETITAAWVGSMASKPWIEVDDVLRSQPRVFFEVIPAAKSFAKTNKKVLGLCQNRSGGFGPGHPGRESRESIFAGSSMIMFIHFPDLSWPSCILLVVLLMTSSAQPKIMSTDAGSPDVLAS